MKPIIYQRGEQNFLGIPGNIKSLIGSCSSVIIILTKEDEQKFGETKVSLVFQYISYCQAVFEDKNVLLLYEEGIELPPNIHGISCISFTVEGIEVKFEELRKKIKQTIEAD